MEILQLNHVALHVADVPRSEHFYRTALRLPQIPRPAFSFPGAWFRFGVDQELHLIGNRTEPVHFATRGTHLALSVDSLEQWEAHLRSLGVEITARRTRPDGALQTYLQDPDGYWIELTQLDTVRS